MAMHACAVLCGMRFDHSQTLLKRFQLQEFRRHDHGGVGKLGSVFAHEQPERCMHASRRVSTARWFPQRTWSTRVDASVTDANTYACMNGHCTHKHATPSHRAQSSIPLARKRACGRVRGRNPRRQIQRGVCGSRGACAHRVRQAQGLDSPARVRCRAPRALTHTWAGRWSATSPMPVSRAHRRRPSCVHTH